jgi:site-specific DNA-methyltransferase (adenine-specific)
MRAEINLYNEDCLQAMRAMQDNQFDLAIVDPPYGIGENGQRNKSGDRPTLKWKNPTSQIYEAFDDSQIPSKEYFEQLFRISKNQIIWGGNYFTEYLPPSKGWIVWNKKADIKEHLSMAELAWTSFDKKCNMFEYLWAGFKKKKQVKRIHPTQKPVDLYRWILQNYAKEGDKIIDTHLGSGSIALACYEEGFDLVGIEIDKKYLEDANNRLKLYKKQQTLCLI